MGQTAKGFFRNAVDALVEARARQARVHVINALRGLDDRTLQEYGYTRKQVQKLGR